VLEVGASVVFLVLCVGAFCAHFYNDLIQRRRPPDQRASQHPRGQRQPTYSQPLQPYHLLGRSGVGSGSIPLVRHLRESTGQIAHLCLNRTGS
jgi:hypothetical protein